MRTEYISPELKKIIDRVLYSLSTDQEMDSDNESTSQADESMLSPKTRYIQMVNPTAAADETITADSDGFYNNCSSVIFRETTV